MGWPAAIAAYAGDWVVAGLDRNGLRPLRYVVTHDGLVIAGSETGMVVVPDTKIAERGRLGPGQMIGINLAEGRLYKDGELKDALTKKCDWSKWIGRAKQMDSLLANSTVKQASLSPRPKPAAVR
jgi:glutamate synthase (NADPH/NADH) large chain